MIEVILGISIIAIGIGIGVWIEEQFKKKLRWYKRLANTPLDNQLEDMKVKGR
jgi:hypothetical protein